MNTLYIRIPSRHSPAWPHGSFAYALCREDAAIVRDGHATLAELAAAIAKSNLVLLIAAADVTLLELTVPPMAESKLKLALPNLVEDQLMSDPGACVLIQGKRRDGGQRSVAVAQRDWLQKLSDHFLALGASQVSALPAQLALPWSAGQCSVWLDDAGQDASLTVRTDEESGVGLLQDGTQPVAAWLTAIAMLAPSGRICLQLPSRLIDDYRAALQGNPAWSERMTVQESHWSGTIQSAQACRLNLMAGLQGRETSRIQWQLWRWPMTLAALILLVNIAALNYDYWNLKREAQTLKQSMLQTFRSSFPKETVVVFPLEQMRKNLDLAERSAGQAAPDDFTLLLTRFAAVWSSMNPASLPKLVSVEYKDRALVLQFKGELVQKDLQNALDNKGLVLKKINADVWQVRNAT